MQNILVVEDDYDLNQAICYSLKKSGYGVYGETLIKKAKQILIENQIDMVLLDVNLPDGEGFSFCRWVKEQKEVPVIYLTARDMEEDALAGYESGAEDYVTKPFSLKILLRKIGSSWVIVGENTHNPSVYADYAVLGFRPYHDISILSRTPALT